MTNPEDATADGIRPEWYRGERHVAYSPATEYDRMRQALISILGLTVDYCEADGRMRVIHKAAMRGLGQPVKERRNAD